MRHLTIAIAAAWEWATWVAAQLEEALADVLNPELLVLAGELYRTVLRRCPLPAAVPMAGLGIGEQLGFLTPALAVDPLAAVGA